MGDNLFQTVLDEQDLMQKKFFPSIQEKTYEEQMLINTRALLHETIEVEIELNWKHWKKPVTINKTKILEEMADQFIFMMNEININKISADDFLAIVMNKINVNIQRQLNGY